MKKRNLIYLLVFSVIIVFGYLFWFLFGSNVQHNKDTRFVYIPTGCTDDQFKRILEDSNIIKRPRSFFMLAQKMGLWGHVKAGRYGIEAGMGNYRLIKMFRSGQQTPVRVVVNKYRTPDAFFQKLNLSLEADSMAFAQAFMDSLFLHELKLNRYQMPSVIIPATYEIWWNASPQQVAQKFAAAYRTFWNDSRRQAAVQLSLSIPEVVTIASIVEEETNQNDEKEDVASVYLNRWRKGMKLDADPTVKFAVGDFSLKRILNVHTAIESPYNTYRVVGLPPGPICTPGAASIDAVLANKKTSYLFFCAREDFNGHHNFAATYEAHLANARRYQQALNERGIR